MNPTSRATTEVNDEMDLDLARRLAEQFGWSDCSRYKRSTVRHQMGTDIEGMSAFVTVMKDGTITWSVHSLDEDIKSQRGTAANLHAAVTACSHTVASVRGTLF